MKVLSLLSAAAVATALPIHANVKVVSLGENGEKSVQTFENVDLGDSMQSATEALNQLVKPHAPTPAKMISESEKKMSEILEKEKKVEKKVEEKVEDHFKELKEQGMENIETLKQQALEFVEQTKELLGDASDRVHKVVDSHGEEAKEPLKSAKNLKGKNHSGKKHGAKAEKSEAVEVSETKSDDKKHGAKAEKSEAVEVSETKSDDKKALRKSNKNHKNNKNNKNNKASKDQVLTHDVKPHAKKPCAKKLKAMKQAKADQDGSYTESVKQWSQDVYQDLSSIDFNKSIGAIRENDDAMCAIAGGFFGGVALLTIMTVIAQFVKGKKSVKLADEEESLNEKN